MKPEDGNLKDPLSSQVDSINEPGSDSKEYQNTPEDSDISEDTKPKRTGGLSFFDPALAPQRKKLKFQFSKAYLIMLVSLLALFSVYWGSMYRRNDRIKNLRMLVVIEDDTTIEGIPPIFGNTILDVLNTPLGLTRGNWNIYNSSEFAQLAAEYNNTVQQEIERQVHHQNYWSSIYVKANATWNFYNALIEGDGDYNVSDNSILSIYETGRDFMAMSQYVTPSIQMMERLWLEQQTNVTQSVLQFVTNTTDVLSQAGTRQLLTTPINFLYVDRIKFTDPVLLAPSQVGFIYMLIFTFFQFNFLGEYHIAVAKSGVKPLHYVIYRYISSVASFFLLSLGCSLVSLAFQVDFTVAFGKSGFLVFWMVSFLNMWALGSACEIAALLCIPHYPPLIGLWLMFWVISNVTPTFTPLALSAKFYRYGYAMPIHNAAEATKVILFDTYKGNLGRHIGILVVWVVLLSLAYPFVLKHFGKAMAMKAKLAAQEKK